MSAAFRRKSALAAAAAVAALLAAASVHRCLAPVRPVSSGASARATSLALGGFRGLLADVLWLRATRLQEERRFVELVQLSDWITELEPDNEEVWVFHAWNLSYNVSFLMSRAEDRWRWVSGGISLLRDRGIPANPRSARLRQELGWIFQHKLGMDSDTASPFYRESWANEISGYLGEDGAAPDVDSISAEELRDSLSMDAGLMHEIENEFGAALDWRLPMASSLYWAYGALRDCAPGEKDEMPCRRMVYSSLIDLSMHGDGANFALVPATVRFIEETMEKNGFSGTRFAYAVYLRDAAILFSKAAPEVSGAYLGKLADFFAGNGIESLPPLERLDDNMMMSLLGRIGIY